MKKKTLSIITHSILCIFALQSVAYAAPLVLATKPLFVSTSVSPNLVLLLDDSGSMAYAYVPDNISANFNTRRFNSAYFNAIAYNPNIVYILPVKSDGTNYTTSFTNAPINGFDSSRGSVNLSTSYRPTSSYNPSATTQSYSNNPTVDFSNSTNSNPAFYYVRDNTLNKCVAANDKDENCYKRIWVNATSGTGNAGADERSNFAIWYSFYRTRNLTVVSGATLALKTLDPSVRVAWTALNTCTTFGTTCAGWDNSKTDNKIRPFTGTQKDSFYSWLSRLPANNGTPLRTGLIRIGDYYKTSGVASPYAQNPQVTVGTESSCRQNYSLVMTDGIWNSDTINIGNLDNTTTNLPDGNAYSSVAPYKDTNSSSLADIAFKYWATDLRPDLPNNLTPYIVDYTGNASQQYLNPKNDPANWQHMTTFTVGLGLTDGLDLLNFSWNGNTYGGEYSKLLSGTTTWPTTGADQNGNVADLWHAALNSRGQFFAAEKPTDILNAFQSIVSRVNSGVGASGSVAANTTSIRSNTNIYQARFNSGDWSGDLLSIPLGVNGTVPTDLISSSIWHAATTVNAKNPNSRVILTNKASTNTGIPFRWPNNTTTPSATELDTVQTNYLSIDPMSLDSDLNGSKRLNYLRGSKTDELSLFRVRNSVLGDIINSSPILVEPPAELSRDSTYNSFKTANANRKTILYVGANDGMLHGFDVDNGNEVLAYVPNAVFNNLNKLSAPNYGHQFYVDGSIVTNNVKFSNNTWHTMLVSSMGNGGRGIFGLDITNPSTFTEANAANIVKFEYTNTQDPDVGYIQGTPSIIKMNNGKYAAVFGNGYNSTGNGQASLFIVDIQTGALIKKISTGVGNLTTPNALSSPALVDIDGNGTADYAYAGDLQGNLWKFDLSSSTTTNWNLAYSNTPLFNVGKPITEQPDLTPHPNGGYMVYFGTGKYIESSDSTDTSANNFYGIWDNNISTITNISQLQPQTVTGNPVLNGNVYRTISNNIVNYSNKRGWFLILPTSGERSITNPLLRGGKIIFTTMIPNAAGCAFGGTSWLMELDYLNGGQTGPLFDTNGDNVVDSSDSNVNGLALSAIGSAPTLLQGLGSLTSPLDRIYLNQSNGMIISTLQSGSRLTNRRTSWIQIINK